MLCEASAVSIRSSYSTTTMTSADFSSYYTNTLRPPPVRAFSFHLFPPDLLESVFVFFGLHKGVLAHPLSQASYPIPVRRYRLLPFGFLQCMGRPKPPCHLLTLPGVTRVCKGLPASIRQVTLWKNSPPSLLKKYLYF